MTTLTGLSENAEFRLILQLKHQEANGGIPALTAYQDTKGIWTIGYGHTQGVQDGQVISFDIAEHLLRKDLEVAVKDAKTLPNYDKLSDVRKAQLINMEFNMGHTRLMGFKNMLDALNELDHRKVSAHAIDSKWVDDVKLRSFVVVTQYRLDRWISAEYWR
jgi:lysozyme